MDMIGHYFERHYFTVKALGLFRQESPEIFLNGSSQHLPTPFRTPDEVEINQGHSCVRVSVFLTHRHSVAIMDQVRQSFKFQLMRSERNKHLDRSINIAAHIWNHSVALHRRYYRMFHRTLKQGVLQSHLAKLRKTRFRHWQLVGSQAVQAITDRLYRGWDAFFKHEIKRPPTFRARRKYKSFTLKQAGWKLVGPGRLRIQGRDYRFHQSREIPGNIKTVTISRDTTGRYFISFSCAEVPMPEPSVKTGQTTGADFGLQNFLTLPCGEHIDAPQPLKQALRQLRIANRRFSRKTKGSRSRWKSRLHLARVHRSVENQRTSFHWKTASQLANRFDAIAVEDLNLTGMKSLWGRKVSDLGFGNFLLRQEWICQKRGKVFSKIDRFEPTTKLMSCCGYIQTVLLSERTVVCQSCGVIHNRDQNAAKNIHEAGRRLWSGADRQTSSEAVCVSTAESHGL